MSGLEEVHHQAAAASVCKTQGQNNAQVRPVRESKGENIFQLAFSGTLCLVI